MFVKANYVLLLASIVPINGELQDVNVGMFLYPFHQKLIGVVADEVVRVNKCYVVTFSNIYSGIASIAQTTIRFVYNSNPVVAFSPFVAHLRTLVRRAVIHENHFHVGITLTYNALQTFVERLLYIIHRYDDT